MKKWWRIIGSFAFLVVFFTALSVALITNHLIPGFTIALGFLLGGIVSPPDAVSTGAITKFVKIPKSTSAILEGESLLNDASSLIIFRFALVAVGTGQFIWQEAALSFLWMVIGGVGIGLSLGWLFVQAHILDCRTSPQFGCDGCGKRGSVHVSQKNDLFEQFQPY
jgi:CPA1 family monovalent cation:H+ antiporter